MNAIRYALRSLSSAPGFTAMAILTLAFGIAANVAIFTVLEAVLIRTLPYPEPDRLVAITGSWAFKKNDLTVTPRPEVTGARGLARAAVYATGAVNVAGGAQPDRVRAAEVSAFFFETMGVLPTAGRPLTGDDIQPSPSAVVIGHGVWIRDFGANSDVIGLAILLNGHSRTIVGVMPSGFDCPDASEIWMPLSLRDQPFLGAIFFRSVGRLTSGVTREAAQAELGAIAARAGVRSTAAAAHVVTVTPLHAALVERIRPMLGVVALAAAFVLLLGCLNVANLLIARGASRRPEMIVRAALGPAIRAARVDPAGALRGE